MTNNKFQEEFKWKKNKFKLTKSTQVGRKKKEKFMKSLKYKMINEVIFEFN